MIKLYKWDKYGMLRFADWGVKGMEHAYLKQGYVIGG